jgi:hypothetical protein
MDYKITVEPTFLRAVLTDRETIEETQKFLQAVIEESAKHERSCILIQVRSSRPVYHVEQNGFIEPLMGLAQRPAHQVALLGDTIDLHISHQYLEFVALQRGLNVRTFRTELAALQWFGSRSREVDRRSYLDRRRRQERRHQQDRRQRRDRDAIGAHQSAP